MLTLLFLLLCSMFTSIECLKVHWNIPSEKCISRNISIDLDEFRIVYNRGHEFIGENVAVLYENKFSKVPHIINGTEYNQGIPQKGNLTTHLSLLENYIKRFIPNEGFAGLAVLDMEHVRPDYDWNWGNKKVYKHASKRHVQERFPEISDSEADEKARNEFNEASRRWMSESLDLAKRMRPFARWGFFGFPLCNYDAGDNGETECNAIYQSLNDRLWEPILSRCTALYPSIYFYTKKTDEANFLYVQAVLKETFRIANRVDPPLPVIPFSKIEYDPYQETDHFYSKRSLCSSLQQSSQMGIREMLIWSSSDNIQSRCNNIDEYLKETFGPTLSLVQKQNDKCRREKCSGHGHCHTQTTQTKCQFKDFPADSSCRCDLAWTGDKCDLPLATHAIEF